LVPTTRGSLTEKTSMALISGGSVESRVETNENEVFEAAV